MGQRQGHILHVIGAQAVSKLGYADAVAVVNVLAGREAIAQFGQVVGAVVTIIESAIAQQVAVGIVGVNLVVNLRQTISNVISVGGYLGAVEGVTQPVTGGVVAVGVTLAAAVAGPGQAVERIVAVGGGEEW